MGQRRPQADHRFPPREGESYLGVPAVAAPHARAVAARPLLCGAAGAPMGLMGFCHSRGPGAFQEEAAVELAHYTDAGRPDALAPSCATWTAEERKFQESQDALTQVGENGGHRRAHLSRAVWRIRGRLRERRTVQRLVRGATHALPLPPMARPHEDRNDLLDQVG